jgi:3-hydroxyacyl-[acyl-carrier-protein] dehydratase
LRSPHKMEDTLDIQEIIKMLPHRYPFLLIDRVVEFIPGEKIVALKNVTYNEPFFRGHFPERPIMPGVLIIEAMAQAGGVLAFASQSEEMHGKPVYFMGMDRVKFWRPAFPGDQIFFSVKFLKKSSWAVQLSGVASVDEKKLSEAELTATFGKIPQG